MAGVTLLEGVSCLQAACPCSEKYRLLVMVECGCEELWNSKV
jgi:hypothetical protein